MFKLGKTRYYTGEMEYLWFLHGMQTPGAWRYFRLRTVQVSVGVDHYTYHHPGHAVGTGQQPLTAPVTECPLNAHTGNTKAINSWPELALPANEWRNTVSSFLKLAIIDRSRGFSERCQCCG